MPVAGGLGIHREQVASGYLGTVTGQVCRGRVSRRTGSTGGPGWRGSPTAVMPRSRPGVHRVAVYRRGAIPNTLITFRPRTPLSPQLPLRRGAWEPWLV